MLFKRSKNAIIIGCGQFGASLAADFDDKGYDVTVVDKERRSFSLLPESYSGDKVIADGSDINALKQAGISQADMVVAATGNDCTNSLICQIASRIYQVRRVYMRLMDPQMERVVEGYGIQVIYPFRLTIQEFEHLSEMKVEDVK